ncbi:MAG: glycosyltransferase [Cyclobacteriaceae bacterium]|nr:glycosyltransferase [Cyclobacteriaceae bacterium]
MKKKRILIIENSMDVTGALKSIAQASLAMRDDFEFIFLLPRRSKCNYYLETHGFNAIYELPMRELRKNVVSLLLYLPVLAVNAIRLKGILRKERIELVHNNDLYNLLPVVARFFGNTVPYIVHIRFLPNKFPRKLFLGWLKLHYKFALYVVCVSNYLFTLLPQHRKLRMIYDGLPFKENHSHQFRKLNCLLYLSNFIQGKGQDLAIEVFSEIAFLYPDWKLRFVGGDMGLKKNKIYKNRLMKMCRQKGIMNQVEWYEFTNDVEAEYKTAAITLNFSDSESFSLTCLEAQFFGCPVIATKSGGPSEIINDGVTGFLVPLGDINKAVRSIEYLIINEKARSDFGIAGKKWVSTKFNTENTSFQLREVYYDSIL